MHIWPNDDKGDNYVRPRPTRQDYETAAAHKGLKLLDRPPQVGESYIAGRNTGLKLLIAQRIDPRKWVVPTDGKSYSYDSWECIAVEEV